MRKEIVQLDRELYDVELRTGSDQPFRNLTRVASGKQAVGNDVAGDRIHAAGQEQPVRKFGIAFEAMRASSRFTGSQLSS